MKDRKIIFGLDVIRFCAAAMVMCFHLGTQSWSDKNAITSRIIAGRASFPELFNAMWFDWIGVEIFFIISGFVIAYSAEGATAREFLRSRILRLYPAVWICASITAVTWMTLGVESRRVIARDWLNSIALDPFLSWIDPSYWTLGIEISFYAFVFILLIFKKFQHLELMALFMGLASSTYWILGTAFAPIFVQHHIWSRKIDLSLVSYGCYFAIGTLAYVISREGLSPIRLIAMTLFIAGGLVEVANKTDFLNAVWGKSESAFWPQALLLIALASIFLAVRIRVSSSNPAARYIRMLGLATYPLYLIHQIVGTAIMASVLSIGGPKYAALAAAMLLCVLFSILIVNFVEPPVRGALQRALIFLSRSPPSNRAVPAGEVVQRNEG